LPLLARTVVLNFGHIVGKKLFANQAGQEHAIIKTLCVIKTFVSWHQEKVGRICRERCGGGSYLQAALIPFGVTDSHSGMTAEGDNSVLMQKVVKDILEHLQKGLHKMPKISKATRKDLASLDDISSFKALQTLVYLREQIEIQ